MVGTYKLRSSLSLATLAVLLACATQRDAPLPVSGEAVAVTAVPTDLETPAPAPAIEIEAVRKHVAFLADDAQEGRAPGTEADARVQAYVEGVLRDAGLEPAFKGAWRQPFELTDGVRVAEGAAIALSAGGPAIPNAPLPFSTDTSSKGPITAKLVFVGHGIVADGPGTGDYAGLAKKVKGNIVVALEGGPNDPHLDPSKLRPQSKLITARDHGAVGFVLWDPASDVPYPNSGQVNDLGLAALFVGKQGNEALTAAFPTTKRPEDAPSDPHAVPIKPGAQSRKPATIHTPVQPITITTANVAGVLPGSGERGGVVVIGAHMDHLGYGTRSSLAPGERAIHNGADDNASGVAVVLELARALARVPAAQRRYDTLFVTFGAEELGLLGSKHFVEHVADVTPERLVAMLNFDMVGRLRPEEGLTIGGAGTSSVWPELIASHGGALKNVKPIEDGFGPSDHSSFYEAGVPVLHFFTGGHADYHKPSDDVATLNFEGAVEIGALARGIATALLEQPLEIDYKQTARTMPAGGGRGFRVSLGTVPDYGAKVDGVRLSGVRPGGPAEEAGLQQGDVITKIGVREIHNIEDYMATFGELAPGTAVPVEIVRDDQPLMITLTPAAPTRH